MIFVIAREHSDRGNPVNAMDRHATLAMTIEVSPRPPSRGPGILSMAHRATALLLTGSRVKPGMTKGPIPACAGMTKNHRNDKKSQE